MRILESNTLLRKQRDRRGERPGARVQSYNNMNGGG
jgi:hypothetical protein